MRFPPCSQTTIKGRNSSGVMFAFGTMIIVTVLETIESCSNSCADVQIRRSETNLMVLVAVESRQTLNPSLPLKNRRTLLARSDIGVITKPILPSPTTPATRHARRTARTCAHSIRKLPGNLLLNSSLGPDCRQSPSRLSETEEDAYAWPPAPPVKELE